MILDDLDALSVITKVLIRERVKQDRKETW